MTFLGRRVQNKVAHARVKTRFGARERRVRQVCIRTGRVRLALFVALFNALVVAMSRLLSRSKRRTRDNAEQMKNELHGADGFHHVDGCRCRLYGFEFSESAMQWRQ